MSELNTTTELGRPTIMATESKPAIDPSDEVLTERVDHVLKLTLNRPERMNSIGGRLLSRLSELFLEAEHDRNVRVILITGAGKAFCSGLDLKDVSSGKTDVENTTTGFGIYETPPFVMRRMDTPIVCALNGAAAEWKHDMRMTAEAQAERVGMHHDGMHAFALDADNASRDFLLALNNEYIDQSALWAPQGGPSGLEEKRPDPPLTPSYGAPGNPLKTPGEAPQGVPRSLYWPEGTKKAPTGNAPSPSPGPQA